MGSLKPIGDGLVNHPQEPPGPAQTIPFQIQFQGLFMVRQRMPIHVRCRRGVMMAGFTLIPLAATPIPSGFDERFSCAVSTF